MALFYCHKAANSGFPHHKRVIFPTIVKPLISNKNVQNRPESEQFREMLGVFYSQKQIRKPGAGREVMQMLRMPKYLKRKWAFFLGDCGRKKYNPLPSDKLLKGAQLICNEPFLRIFTRLNIQNTDFVFVRHCNNSFFDNKNTAVSGDTAGVTKNLGNCAAISYENDISKCSFLQSCIYR